MTQVPGAVIAVEQPLQHVISQMLSGVKAQVGIKLYGDNLEILRTKAKEIKAAIQNVPGVKDLMVEQQVEIPQLRIDLDRQALASYGLNSDDVNELIETAMNGRVVSEIVLGQQKFDLLVRLDDPFRQDPQAIAAAGDRTAARRPGRRSAKWPGWSTPAGRTPSTGKTCGGGSSCSATRPGAIWAASWPKSKNVWRPSKRRCPQGYFIQYSGQFESQQLGHANNRACWAWFPWSAC